LFYIGYTKKITFIIYPFLFLIRKYCLRNKIYISVNNIPFAIGHLYPEIDYLLRVLSVDDKYKDEKFLYIYPKNNMLDELSTIFSGDNFKIIQSGVLHMLFYFAALKFKEIRVDCSLSSNAYHKSGGLDNHKHVFEGKFRRYAELYRKSSEYYPLSKFGKENPMPEDLIELIGPGKYAVIQIKDVAANATWKVVDPNTYNSAILILKEMGYRVVLAGREEMPNNFKSLGVINYSESKYASPLNDYHIVYNSSLVISSASGFSLMADLLDKPLLMLNIWQLSNCIGRRTIFIPTIILNKNKKMNFQDQYKFFIDLDGVNSKGLSSYQKEMYRATDAKEKDIELALLELIKTCLHKECIPRTPLQLYYNSLFPRTWTSSGLSRISDDFLRSNMELL